MPRSTSAGFTGAPARLAATLQRDGRWDLYALDIDGSGLTRLTDTPEREVRPVWSPDGEQVAFSVGRPMGP